MKHFSNINNWQLLKSIQIIWFEMWFCIYVSVTLSRVASSWKFLNHEIIHAKKDWTHEIQKRKKFLTHEIPTQKKVGSMKYPREKLLTNKIPTKARWHYTTRTTMVRDSRNLAHSFYRPLAIFYLLDLCLTKTHG